MTADRRPPTGIELHIEELVLHGFPTADRYRIAGALECELRRLFAEQSVPPVLARGGEFRRLDLEAFNVPRGSKADAVGAEVAREVYAGLRRMAN